MERFNWKMSLAIAVAIIIAARIGYQRGRLDTEAVFERFNLHASLETSCENPYPEKFINIGKIGPNFLICDPLKHILFFPQRLEANSSFTQTIIIDSNNKQALCSDNKIDWWPAQKAKDGWNCNEKDKLHYLWQCADCDTDQPYDYPTGTRAFSTDKKEEKK